MVSTAELRKCPYTKRKCMGRECHLWGEMEVLEGGHTKIKEDCVHVLSFIATRSAAARAFETNAAFDKLATAVTKNNFLLQAVDEGQKKLKNSSS